MGRSRGSIVRRSSGSSYSGGSNPFSGGSSAPSAPSSGGSSAPTSPTPSAPEGYSVISYGAPGNVTVVGSQPSSAPSTPSGQSTPVNYNELSSLAKANYQSSMSGQTAQMPSTNVINQPSGTGEVTVTDKKTGTQTIYSPSGTQKIAGTQPYKSALDIKREQAATSAQQQFQERGYASGSTSREAVIAAAYNIGNQPKTTTQTTAQSNAMLSGLSDVSQRNMQQSIATPKAPYSPFISQLGAELSVYQGKKAPAGSSLFIPQKTESRFGGFVGGIPFLKPVKNIVDTYEKQKGNIPSEESSQGFWVHKDDITQQEYKKLSPEADKFAGFREDMGFTKSPQKMMWESFKGAISFEGQDPVLLEVQREKLSAKATEQFSRGRSTPGFETAYENLVGGSKGLLYEGASKVVEVGEFMIQKPKTAAAMAIISELGGPLLGFAEKKIAPLAPRAASFVEAQLSKSIVKTGIKVAIFETIPAISAATAPEGEKTRAFLGWNIAQLGIFGAIEGITEIKAKTASKSAAEKIPDILDITTLSTERSKAVGIASDKIGTKAILSEVRTSAATKNPITGERGIYSMEASPEIRIQGKKGKYGGIGEYEYNFNKISDPLRGEKLSYAEQSKQPLDALTPEKTIKGRQTVRMEFNPSRYDYYTTEAAAADVARINEVTGLLEYKGKPYVSKGKPYVEPPTGIYTESRVRSVTGFEETRLTPPEGTNLLENARVIASEWKGRSRAETISRHIGKAEEFELMLKKQTDPLFVKEDIWKFTQDLTGRRGRFVQKEVFRGVDNEYLRPKALLEGPKGKAQPTTDFNPYAERIEGLSIGQRTGIRIEEPFASFNNKEMIQFKEASLSQENFGTMSQKLSAQQLRLQEKVMRGRGMARQFAEEKVGAGTSDEFDMGFGSGGRPPEKININFFEEVQSPSTRPNSLDIFEQSKKPTSQTPEPSTFTAPKLETRPSPQGGEQSQQAMLDYNTRVTEARNIVVFKKQAGDTLKTLSEKTTRDLIIQEEKIATKQFVSSKIKSQGEKVQRATESLSLGAVAIQIGKTPSYPKTSSRTEVIQPPKIDFIISNIPSTKQESISPGGLLSITQPPKPGGRFKQLQGTGIGKSIGESPRSMIDTNTDIDMMKGITPITTIIPIKKQPPITKIIPNTDIIPDLIGKDKGFRGPPPTKIPPLKDMSFIPPPPPIIPPFFSKGADMGGGGWDFGKQTRTRRNYGYKMSLGGLMSDVKAKKEYLKPGHTFSGFETRGYEPSTFRGSARKKRFEAWI